MNTAQFVETLAELSFKDAFNPYADACGDFDRDDAPAIRRTNLKLVLDAAIESKVDSIWIARDLGYRGGRRTGLALTDEAHLNDHSTLYGNLPLARATRGPADLRANCDRDLANPESYSAPGLPVERLSLASARTRRPSIEPLPHSS